MAYCHQFPNLDTFNEKGKELLKYSICFMHSFQWISIHLFFHIEAFLTTSAFCHFFRHIHQLLSKHHTKMKKNNMKHFHLLSLKKPELDFSAFFVLVMDWFDFWSTTNWTQCFLMELSRTYNTESFASNSVLVLAQIPNVEVTLLWINIYVKMASLILSCSCKGESHLLKQWTKTYWNPHCIFTLLLQKLIWVKPWLWVAVDTVHKVSPQSKHRLNWSFDSGKTMENASIVASSIL